MKHVFSVHSPITFLAAHAVIKNLHLPVSNVVILTNGYKVPIEKYPVHPFYSRTRTNFFQKLIHLNVPKNEDSYLTKIIGDEHFTAYIDIMAFHQRALITHPQCKRINFIEEGNVHYRDLDTLTDLTWDQRSGRYRANTFLASLMEAAKAAKWALRGYTQRMLHIPYSYTSYIAHENSTFFGFDDTAFPVVPNSKKHVLKLEPDAEIAKMAGNVSIEGSVIWVDGSNSRFTGLPEEDYHHAIDKAIDKLDLKSKRIYIKLRPGFTDYNANYLYRKLKGLGYEVEVLPDNLIIECVFINSQNCLVVGNLSSALFYAALAGHRAVSLYSLFQKRVPTYFDQMPGFWDKVEQL